MTSFFAQFKLYIIAAVVALLLAGMTWFGVHERHIGAAKVQAKWDIAVAAQNVVTVDASEKARKTEQLHAGAFDVIASNYLKATSHAETPFDLPAALAAGTLRLRNDCPAPDPRSVPQATARSRELDAAYTSALAHRAENQARAIRVHDYGKEADAREITLRAQVTALQSILKAERTEAKP